MPEIHNLTDEMDDTSSGGKTLKSFAKVGILALNGPRGDWSKMVIIGSHKWS